MGVLAQMAFWPARANIHRGLVVLTSISIMLIWHDVSFGNDLAGRLKELKDQYQSIDSIHLKASTDATVDLALIGGEPGTTDVVHNTYEYWAKDRNYRFKSFYESKTMPRMHWDVAYNGTFFQMYDREISRFTFGREDKDPVPMAPVNPLYHPLTFLSRNDDNCRTCTLKLIDVTNDNIWEKKIAKAKLITTSDQTPGQMVAEFPGGVMDGKDFVFHVYFGDNPDWLPVRINRVETNGTVITSTVIEEYESVTIDGRILYLPKSVDWTLPSEEGRLPIRFRTNVEQCQINKELPPDIFTIDYSSADIVWDDDLRVFLKTEKDDQLFSAERLEKPAMLPDDNVGTGGSPAVVPSPTPTEETRPVAARPSEETSPATPTAPAVATSPALWPYIVLVLAVVLVIAGLIALLLKRRRAAGG